MKKFLTILAVSFLAAFVLSSCKKDDDSAPVTYPTVIEGAFAYASASTGYDAFLYIEQISGGWYGYFTATSPSGEVLRTAGSFTYDSATGEGVLTPAASGAVTVNVKAYEGTVAKKIHVTASQVISGTTVKVEGDFDALESKDFITGFWSSDNGYTLQINNLTGGNLGVLTIPGGQDSSKVTKISKFYLVDDYVTVGVITFDGEDIAMAMLDQTDDKNILYLSDGEDKTLEFPYYEAKAPKFPSVLAGAYACKNASTGYDAFLFIEQISDGFYGYFISVGPSTDTIWTEGTFKYNASTGAGLLTPKAEGGYAVAVKAEEGAVSKVVYVEATQATSGTTGFTGTFNALRISAFTTGYWTSSILADENVFQLQINNLKGDNLGSFGLVGGEDADKVAYISEFYILDDENNIKIGRIQFEANSTNSDYYNTFAMLNGGDDYSLSLMYQDKRTLDMPYYSAVKPAYPEHLTGIYSASNASTAEHGSILLTDNLGGQYAHVQIYDSKKRDSLLYDITGAFKYDAAKGTGVISDTTQKGATIATIQAVPGTDETFALTVVNGAQEISRFTCIARETEPFNGGNGGTWTGNYIKPGAPAETATLKINDVTSSQCGTLTINTGDVMGTAIETTITITGISEFVTGDSGSVKYGVFRGIVTIPGSQEKGFTPVSANIDYSNLVIKYDGGILKLNSAAKPE